MFLAKMTTEQAAQAFRLDPVILLPVGSCEQHGPQCALGTDFLIPDHLARQVEALPNLIAVSYTHLDVYKRQGKRIATRPWMWSVMRSLHPVTIKCAAFVQTWTARFSKCLTTRWGSLLRRFIRGAGVAPLPMRMMWQSS